MAQDYDIGTQGPVSEMAIVDAFTRLIFGEEGELSSLELTIVETFRSVDPNVQMDTLPEMGEYLRNLGVREMIHLVSRIRQEIELQARGAMDEASEGEFAASGLSSGRT